MEPLLRPPGPPDRGGRLRSLPFMIGFALDPLRFVRKRFERFGDIYYVPNDEGGFYVMRHPDHIHAVLVTHAAKMSKGHSAFAMLSRVVGDGLLTSDGDVWRRQRRMLQPAFTRARLADYARAMVDEGARARDELRAGATEDVSRAMMELTLRVVCRTLFSHDVRGQTDDVAPAMTALQQQVARPDLLPAWVPTPGRRRFRASVEAIDRVVYSMIAARRSAPDAPPDLLQSLLTAADDETGERLSDKELRDQLVTLFLAGHETTSHALTWTLYLLSQNPAAERALHEELDRVLAGRLPTADDPLPYTEQVLKESMRIYPPVYLIARRATEPVEIGGYTVPAGTELVLWVYMCHHDARFFPEPSAFRPERFAGNAEQLLPKGAYAPFGAGPRACIGKTFAMLEARLLLAILAQRYRFELARGQRVAPNPRVTLNPKFGMRMIPRVR